MNQRKVNRIPNLSFRLVHSLQCYQCVSTNNTDPFQCNEFLSSDIDIKPQPCDAVYEAQYCVKHTGRFEGKTISAVQVTYRGKGNFVAKLSTLKRKLTLNHI